ncbi:hypothetical protein CCACVL1_06739 [Corchorus capsularis]|uniref:Uncharacterized protein n=1 Tax=Corchorus capsularis TaxID=210143 RepID=A0A1R3JDE7_COCAP|nr:hypothetical protein CCACVL1_06739 [Corchorus capsularis]
MEKLQSVDAEKIRQESEEKQFGIQEVIGLSLHERFRIIRNLIEISSLNPKSNRNSCELLRSKCKVVCEYFVQLQKKNDHGDAINQIQTMITCLDFTTDFVSLSAHEAGASLALPVVVAALSNFLNFYNWTVG